MLNISCSVVLFKTSYFKYQTSLDLKQHDKIWIYISLPPHSLYFSWCNTVISVLQAYIYEFLILSVCVYMYMTHRERQWKRETKRQRETAERSKQITIFRAQSKKKKKNAAKKCVEPLFQKLLNVDLKNIHNLEVESYVLFGGNFFGFHTWRKNFK